MQRYSICLGNMYHVRDTIIIDKLTLDCYITTFGTKMTCLANVYQSRILFVVRNVTVKP